MQFFLKLTFKKQIFTSTTTDVKLTNSLMKLNQEETHGIEHISYNLLVFTLLHSKESYTHFTLHCFKCDCTMKSTGSVP